MVPWEEFAGYRRVSWRSLPHLQLIPRQASQLAQNFSMLGRFEQFCARLVRAPSFAIAVTPLDVDEVALEDEIRKYLTPLRGPPFRPSDEITARCNQD